MRGTHGYGGPITTLGLEDKIAGNKTREIHGVLSGPREARCIIYIQDEVRKTNIEEPGFHIRVYPKGVSPLERQAFLIYMSKERFKQLTTVWDSDARGGAFSSRCAYDRTEILYLGEDLKDPSRKIKT